MSFKCPNCNSENISDGTVQTADSLKLCFLSSEQVKKVFPKTKKVAAKACKDCGYISFFIKD